MISAELQTALKNHTHHAFLLVGDPKKNFDELRLFFRKKISAGELESADLWLGEFETLSIDEAREFKSVQNTRPVGERRFMLVSLRTIQAEAQNSLLKLFEDPSSQTTFIVCASGPSIFLPTLLSRLNIISTHSHADRTAAELSPESEKMMRIFLAGPIQKRLSLLEPIIKEKDKAAAEKFLNELEFFLHEDKKAHLDMKQAETRFVFENIFSARRFLASRSPSVKMILENLCGIVPLQ